jgi:hypothetical protein
LQGRSPLVKQTIQHRGDGGHVAQQFSPVFAPRSPPGSPDCGRSRLDVQTQIDTCHIKNWSIWLDLYILTHTARAVLFPNGAY